MKNIDYVIKRVAKERGLSEDVVRVVLDSYWKEALKKVKDMESPAIFFRNIGTFYIPYKMLQRNILNLIGSQRNNPEEYKIKMLKKLLKIRPTISKHYYELTRKRV